MSRHAVVRTADQAVVNIVEWDGTTPYTTPAGHTIRPAHPDDHITVDPDTARAATIRHAAVQAIDTNRAYTALPSPTAAQTTTQVKALSRQQNGLIRLLLGALDATD